jgi:hypothetical protein
VAQAIAHDLDRDAFLDQLDPSTPATVTRRDFAESLEAVGVVAESPWDLVNRRGDYTAALPVLLDWLELPDSEFPIQERQRFREGIVRSLTVPNARGLAGPALVREFRRPGTPPGYRWAVGNALELVATDDIFDDVATIAADRSFGRDRQMVVMGLGRSRDRRAVGVLLGVLDDDTVVGHAVTALGRLRAVEARDAIEALTTHPKAWVRKEAVKALAKVQV